MARGGARRGIDDLRGRDCPEVSLQTSEAELRAVVAVMARLVPAITVLLAVSKGKGACFVDETFSMLRRQRSRSGQSKLFVLAKPRATPR